MRRIPLKPYPGDVYFTRDKAEYLRTYRRHTGEVFGGKWGEGVTAWTRRSRVTKEQTYFVFARSPSALAHEMGHVILDLFDLSGIDPREANGEPFCYMLSHLLDECMKKAP